MPLASDFCGAPRPVRDVCPRACAPAARAQQPPGPRSSRPHPSSPQKTQKNTQDSGDRPRHHGPIKPPLPSPSSLPPPCGLRSDVDWLASNKAHVAAACLQASLRRAAEAERLRTRPPPRALDGKDGAASAFWLRHKPGYGVAPAFCCSGGGGGGESGGVDADISNNLNKRRRGKPAAASSISSPAAAAAATTTTPTATPLPESERLALLAKAQARRASLAAQYGRLPLCFATDTPSGARRREQLGLALDQASRDVDILEKAGRVVVVVVAASGDNNKGAF